MNKLLLQLQSMRRKLSMGGQLLNRVTPRLNMPVLHRLVPQGLGGAIPADIRQVNTLLVIVHLLPTTREAPVRVQVVALLTPERRGRVAPCPTRPRGSRSGMV